MGCATIDLNQRGGAIEPRSFFGFVRVIPATNDGAASGGIRRLELTTVGIRVGSGLSVGYVRDSLLSVPLDCRMAVFVRSRSELDHAVATLKALGKEELCATHFSQ